MRIIVIGCPGAGKSYFSKKLSERTGITLYHLDLLFWKPDQSHISTEELAQKLSEIMEEDDWIIDGYYNTTLRQRIESCDVVFFLDYSLETCLAGAKERRGKKRDDLPWIEPPELDEEFLSFILNFHKHGRTELLSLLKEFENKKQYVFKTREESDSFLKQQTITL